MEHTTQTQESARLERPLAGRSLAGVAASLGNYFNIPVGFVRVAFVVSAFFGGVGIAAYLAGWVLIKGEGEEESLVEGWLGNAKAPSSWIGLGLVAIAITILVGSIDVFSGAAVFAIGLVVLGILVYRGVFDDGMPSFMARPRPPGARAAAVDEATTPADGDAVTDEGVEDGDDLDAARQELDAEIPVPGGDEPPATHVVTAPSTAHVVTVPPHKRRQRSRLGRFTLAALLITIGSMAVADTGDLISFSGGDYFAVALILVGVGLAIGTMFGRAYSLVVIGLILIALVQVNSWFDLRLGGGFGDPTYRVDRVAELESEYRLLAGQLRLDLSGLNPVGRVQTDVSLGAGELLVEVPDDVNVVIDVRIVAGELNTPAGHDDGIDIRHVFENRPAGAVGTISIDAEVGFGQLNIDLASR